MRRGPGIAGLQKAQEAKQKLRAEGEKLDSAQLEAMSEQLQLFKSRLETFALQHKRDINRDPLLRKRFHEMCSSIGVDPLSSNNGFWSRALGVGDFYYEIGVQVIDACLRTRHRNGGFIELPVLLEYLNASRPKTATPVTADDVERAVTKLQILGSGFALKTMGTPPNDYKMVQSVPLELNLDHVAVIQLAKDKGCISKSMLAKQLKWDGERCRIALEFLESEGIAWIDDQDPSHERHWYVMALYKYAAN